jgi:hypothetical protein
MPSKYVTHGNIHREKSKPSVVKKTLLFTCALLPMLCASVASEAATFVPFQKRAQSFCPGDAFDCQIPVLTMPAKRRFEVQNFTCHLRVEGTGQIRRFYLLGSTGFSFFAATLTNEGAGLRDFAFNTATKFIVAPGEGLQVGMLATSDIQEVICNVAGEVEILP